MTFPFTKNGFTHTLIMKAWPVCLVERTSATGRKHYEVAIMQEHAEHRYPDGRFVPPGWHYPRSEQWGIYGWTYTDLPKACARYSSEAQKRGFNTETNQTTTTP